MIYNFLIDERKNSIYYLHADDTGKTTLMRYACQNNLNQTVIPTDKHPMNAEMYQDNEKIIFELGDDIYSFDIVSQTYEPVFIEDGYISGFCNVSHDNSHVAFTALKQNSHPNIFITDLDAKETFKLTDSSYGNRFPYWSYSNKHLAYIKQKLSDINKRKYIGVYCIQTGKEIILQKDLDSECFINRCCWDKNKERLVYIQSNGTTSKVYIYSLEDNSYVKVLEETEILEVSFINEDKILLTYNNYSQIYSLSSKEKVKIMLSDGETIKRSFRGIKIRLINNKPYFLSSLNNIYQLELDGELRLMMESRHEKRLSIKKETHYFTTSDNVEIPIVEMTPEAPNGMNCMLVIGGPGESVKCDDFVANGLLKKGIKVFSVGYRGCAEVPYQFGEMCKRDVVDIIEVGTELKTKLGYKIPIAGYSYGGLLTYIALSQCDDVFSCGISLWGVSSAIKLPLYQKYYIDEEMSDLEKQIANNTRNAVCQSVHIKTPMLILHGGKDTTSSLDEVILIKNNILTNNKICDLFSYPDDGHGLSNNPEGYLNRIVEFIRKIE